MSHFAYAHLSDRALLHIHGEDATKFLHNIVTCSVETLEAGQGAFGALLTPQGKILFDFFLVRTADGYLADVTKSFGDDFIKRLHFYKLRAKVDIAPADPELSVFAVWNGKTENGQGVAIRDPRSETIGFRSYSTDAPEAELADYDAHRIACGVPEGGKDYVYGDAFPHEALMDQFGGVDFVKGCYVGQEVVSRMQHRGTARKRIVMVEAADDLPSFNTEIMAGKKPIGAMGSSRGSAGLAMVRLDRASAAMKAGDPFLAGTQAVTLKLPPYVNFDWP